MELTKKIGDCTIETDQARADIVKYHQVSSRSKMKQQTADEDIKYGHICNTLWKFTAT